MEVRAYRFVFFCLFTYVLSDIALGINGKLYCMIVVILDYFQRQPFRFLFYSTAAGAKCHVASVKCLPVLHHSADYIFHFILDHWSQSGYFKYRIPHKQPVLGDVCSLANNITLKRRNKASLRFSYFWCSLFPKVIFQILYLISPEENYVRKCEQYGKWQKWLNLLPSPLPLPPSHPLPTAPSDVLSPG